MLWILALLLVPCAVAEDRGPAMTQAAVSGDVSRSAAVTGSPEAAAGGSRRAFGENPAAPVDLKSRRFKAAPLAQTTPAQPAAKPAAPPALTAGKVYAANAAAAKEEKPSWDYDGTVKAGAVALAGAAIGFMLGGPIGAAAGFLAAFFVGALLWKGGVI